MIHDGKLVKLSSITAPMFLTKITAETVASPMLMDDIARVHQPIVTLEILVQMNINRSGKDKL